MRILIANDDGYLAPGLAALVKACEGLGELDVVAPEQNASGTSNSLTLEPRRSRSTPPATAFATSTARRPTASTSRSPGCSSSGPTSSSRASTTAPTWATTRSIRAPSPRRWKASCSAFRRSRSRRSRRAGPHLDAAARVARSVIEQVLREPPARAPCLLNVNIPNRADADTLPRRITRLGRRHASEPVIRQISPRGETMYWIGPAGDAREAGPGTDFHATANGAGLDHAAAGRPHRPRTLPALARLARHGPRHERPRRGAPQVSAARSIAVAPAPAARAAQVARAAAAAARRVAACARATRRGTRAPSGLGLDSADVRQRMVERLRAGGVVDAARARRVRARCRAISSSTPRWPRRPTRTPACRSATARRSRSRRSSPA